MWPATDAATLGRRLHLGSRQKPLGCRLVLCFELWRRHMVLDGHCHDPGACGSVVSVCLRRSVPGLQSAVVLQTFECLPASSRTALPLSALSVVGVAWARTLSAGDWLSATPSEYVCSWEMVCSVQLFPRRPGGLKPTFGALLLSASSWKLA